MYVDHHVPIRHPYLIWAFVLFVFFVAFLVPAMLGYMSALFVFKWWIDVVVALGVSVVIWAVFRIHKHGGQEVTHPFEHEGREWIGFGAGIAFCMAYTFTGGDLPLSLTVAAPFATLASFASIAYGVSLGPAFGWSVWPYWH